MDKMFQKGWYVRKNFERDELLLKIVPITWKYNNYNWAKYIHISNFEETLKQDSHKLNIQEII